MEIVSNDFRPTLYSGEANHTANLTIGGVAIANENIKSIKLSNPIIDKTNDTFYIGTFVSKQLEIEFWNVDEIDLTGQIHLSIGTYIESLEDYEMVNIGYFNIESSPEDYYKNAKIVALDNGVKFKPNVDYSDALNDDGLITCENLLIWLCDYFDVTLGTYPNINRNIEISTYDSSISGKQYISYIAEIMGGNAQIGRNGELNIIPLKQTPSVQIDATQGKSWQLKGKYEISGVTFFDAIRDIPFSFGDDTYNTLYIRSDNPFVVGDNEESNNIIENIYNEVVGTIIYNVKCENYADYSLDCWDYIEYTLDDETYVTINNNEYTYQMTIMGKVEVDIPNKAVEKTTNTVEGNETTKFNVLKTVIDQQQNEIRIIAGQSDELESQVNTLTASQSGLSNALVKAGCNNLIKNSALFFKEEDGKYEYWNGSIERGNADENGVVSETRTTILTQTEKASQSIDVTPDIYTLSFKYKRLSITSDITFMINNEELVFENLDEGEIIKTISNDTNTITIDFKSSIANGYCIYDLMLNKGDTALDYSQNANETITDTVQIGKGISVTSNSTDTITKVDSDGFRVLNKNNEDDVLLRATDTGTDTKTLTVRSWAEISGLRFQETNEQTWITGII